MKKKIVISTVCVAAAVIGIGGYVYASNRFELISDKVQLEYKETLDTSVSRYVEASDRILEQTKVDLSAVDINTVGEYKATATYGNKVLEFTVTVADTVAPEVKFNDELKGIAGKEITGADIIDTVEDKAGIKSLAFAQNQQSEYKADLSEVALLYDKPGTYENTLVVEDNNGNKIEEDFTLKIVEDYEAHVSGIADMIVEQNAEIDWMQNIAYDEKIAEVTADATGVDIATPGEYTLVYKITGDDQETVVEKTVKVTVITAEDAQNRANAGETVLVTGGVKEKSVSLADTGSGYSSGSHNGTSSEGGSYSSSGGSYIGSGTGSGTGFTSGQSWDMNKTDEGYIGNGSAESGGNWAESGTWNPFG